MSDDKIPFDAMFCNSRLMYAFGSLREVVNNHSKTFGAIDNGFTKVEFDQPDLIVTQNDERDLESRSNAFLKTSVSAIDILKFLQLNRNFFDENLQFNENWKEKTALNTDKFRIEDELKLMAEKDAEFWEYDDQFSKRDLVYGLIVNRAEKRIVIAFRGSVTRKDWIMNAKISKSREAFKELKFANEKGFVGEKKRVRVHRGFAKYLFSQKSTGDGTKFGDILKDLQDVYSYKKDGKDYSDYKLFITGHSLGGALSSLVSVALAGCDICETYPAMIPVTAITYASPRVGGKAFKKTHMALEKSNMLRHIRVTNNGDIIPVFPPLYKQTGLNIHAYKHKPAHSGYDDRERWLIAQIRFYSGKRHSLPSHHKHLHTNDINLKNVVDLSVRDLYAKIAKIDDKRGGQYYDLANKIVF